MAEMIIMGAVVTPAEAMSFRSAIAPYDADRVIRGIIVAVGNGSLKLGLMDADAPERDGKDVNVTNKDAPERGKDGRE